MLSATYSSALVFMERHEKDTTSKLFFYTEYRFYYSPMHTALVCEVIQSLTGLLQLLSYDWTVATWGNSLPYHLTEPFFKKKKLDVSFC